MKRILLLLSCAFFATLPLTTSAQFFVGPKAGINFNSLRKSKDYKNHFDVIPGFNAGGYVKYPVLPYLNARVELLYMQQGANTYDYRMMSDLTRRNVKVRFHNIEVPVLAEFGLPSLAEDILQPKILIGGFYSYTIYARESFVNVAKLEGRDPVAFDGHTNVSSQFYPAQYGIIAAVAAELKIFSKPVSIEFRYQYNANRANRPGTQNQYNLSATTEKWGDELHLHTLSINVGVTLYNF
jgi:hypothetical protein